MTTSGDKAHISEAGLNWQLAAILLTKFAGNPDAEKRKERMARLNRFISSCQELVPSWSAHVAWGLEPQTRGLQHFRQQYLPIVPIEFKKTNAKYKTNNENILSKF